MLDEELKTIFQKIEYSKNEMVRFLSDIIKIPALGPEFGGDGEEKKVGLIQKYLKKFGFRKFERFDALDNRVSSGKRPNLIAWLRGKSHEKRLLIITHTDVVPPGDTSQWKTDPYNVLEKEERLYGRGVEDNGQSITSSIFAAKALMDLDLRPAYDVGLIFVADEEIDNEKGIKYLINKDLFRNEDMILVPDHGTPDGRLIDIAEKSILWIKISTKGKQCHASMPDLGNNAFRAAMKFAVMVDEILHKKFNYEDKLFDYPISTFEPTKTEPNVSNVNTIPGNDVFFMDCRILPQYKTADVISEMKNVAKKIKKKTGTNINIDYILNDPAAPNTSTDSVIVKRLMKAVNLIYNNRPFPGGIGGGTCAAVFRHAGHPAVAWEAVDNTAHAPNEYIKINNMVNDCKVFAALYLDDC
jgi:succinyl-diaminopimelate desuccinylase